MDEKSDAADREGEGLELTSDSSFPHSVVHRGVYHCSDHDASFALDHFVDNSVRKSFRVSPANVFAWMSPAMKQRINSKSVQY